MADRKYIIAPLCILLVDLLIILVTTDSVSKCFLSSNTMAYGFSPSNSTIIQPSPPGPAARPPFSSPSVSPANITGSTSAIINPENMTGGSSVNPAYPTPNMTGPASSNATTSSTSFLTYESATYGIKIQYPSDWTTEEGDNDLAAPGDKNIVTIVPSGGTDNRGPLFYHTFLALNIGKPKDTDLGTYLADSIKSYSGRKDFSVVESNTTTTLSGQPAYVLISTDSGGFDSKSMEIGTIIDGKAYYIDYQSDPDTYNNNLPIINRMLSSLQLPSNVGSGN
jgi:photosystem II reaction center protein PsbP